MRVGIEKVFPYFRAIPIVRKWETCTGPVRTDSHPGHHIKKLSAFEHSVFNVAVGIERRRPTGRVGVAGFACRQKPVTDSHVPTDFHPISKRI
jgi:hypothetical protein